jgi:SAM-dependent methyltransferase
MSRPDWVPEDVDMTVPSPARMYDALLGGAFNFEADRRAAAMAVQLVPDLADVAHSNRAFLRRALRFLLDAGVRQFIDIGAGIPGAGSTHELAQRSAPDARVVYVDIDPVAVAHGQAILAGNDRTVAISGDLRHPEQLLADPVLLRTVDLTQPVGVLLVAVLHLLTDQDQPDRVVATIRDAVSPGSYLVISHLSSARRPDEAAKLAAQSRELGVPITFRSEAEIAGYFAGLQLVEPGLVDLPSWRPESAEDLAEDPERSLGMAGVGLRP